MVLSRNDFKILCKWRFGKKKMEGSINGGTPKSSILKGFSMIFPYKPSIWGYPHFRKPPFIHGGFDGNATFKWSFSCEDGGVVWDHHPNEELSWNLSECAIFSPKSKQGPKGEQILVQWQENQKGETEWCSMFINVYQCSSISTSHVGRLNLWMLTSLLTKRLGRWVISAKLKPHFTSLIQEKLNNNLTHIRTHMSLYDPNLGISCNTHTHIHTHTPRRTRTLYRYIHAYIHSYINSYTYITVYIYIVVLQIHSNQRRLHEENVWIGGPGELLLQWRAILIAIHLRHHQMLHLSAEMVMISPCSTHHATNKAKGGIKWKRKDQQSEICDHGRSQPRKWMTWDDSPMLYSKNLKEWKPIPPVTQLARRISKLAKLFGRSHTKVHRRASICETPVGSCLKCVWDMWGSIWWTHPLPGNLRYHGNTWSLAVSLFPFWPTSDQHVAHSHPRKV